MLRRSLIFLSLCLPSCVQAIDAVRTGSTPQGAPIYELSCESGTRLCDEAALNACQGEYTPVASEVTPYTRTIIGYNAQTKSYTHTPVTNYYSSTVVECLGRPRMY